MPFPGTGLIRRERARMRRFFGLDLPERTLALRFEPLPTTQRRSQRRGQRVPLSAASIDAHLVAHRATPTDYLEALLALARGLNRHPLPEARRWLVTEALCQRACRELLPQLRTMAREGGGIPEAAGRARQMELSLRLVGALIDGYRLIFAADYARGRFWYVRARPRVHRCAGRILELIRLQHRLVGLRYAPLPANLWRLANTLFAVMRAYEGTDVPLPTLAALADTGETPTPSPTLAPSAASLEQLYGAIQTYRLLDYAAWPEVGQAYIDTYCQTVDRAIRVHDYDGYSPIGVKDALLAGCYQDSPPARELPHGRTPAELGPCVIIDYRILAQTIRYDFVELSRARAERNRMAMPPRLAPLEPVYQTAVGFLLHRNLRPPEHWEGAAGASQERRRDLRIYVGLQEVRAHLLTIFSDSDRMHQTRELSNIFARRSAMIGADDSATKESLWHVLFEGEQRLRIKTQETQFTHRMFIGNLLAYGFGLAEAYQPRIGKVNRIFRPEPGSVIIDIDYLARFAAPVALHRRVPDADPDAGAAQGKVRVMPDALQSLLIEHPTRGWGLITPPQDEFWEQTPVAIRSGPRVGIAELGEAEDVTAEFCWFGLPAAPFPNQTPTYPADAAERAARVNELKDIA